MKPKFIDIDDFIGETQIIGSSFEGGNDYFNDIAARKEQDYLLDCLGDKLYSDLLADLVNDVPQTQKFIDLVNGVEYLSCDERTVIYEGFKPMLRYFIYYDYVNTDYYRQMVSGAAIPSHENAKDLSDLQLAKMTNQRWNAGIKFYNGIVRFVYEKNEDYLSESNDFCYWIGAVNQKLPKNRIQAFTSGCVNKSVKFPHNLVNRNLIYFS